MVIVLLVLLFDIVLFGSMLTGAPFVPSRNRTVEAMIETISIGQHRRAVDLGAGDGRIVIALAQAGLEAHGYEINPFLVLVGKYKIFRVGLRGKAFLHWQNFWHIKLSDYDVIVVYGIFYVMPRLAKKLRQEVISPTLVISEAFQLPSMPSVTKTDGFYIYYLPI